jgi:hypothetical protein
MWFNFEGITESSSPELRELVLMVQDLVSILDKLDVSSGVSREVRSMPRGSTSHPMREIGKRPT